MYELEMKMNIRLALQNTLSQFPGLAIQQMEISGTFWWIQVVKEDSVLTFEVDEIAQVACVLERKNVGYRGVNKFMNIFMNEMEQTGEEEEDPRPIES